MKIFAEARSNIAAFLFGRKAKPVCETSKPSELDTLFLSYPVDGVFVESYVYNPDDPSFRIVFRVDGHIFVVENECLVATYNEYTLDGECLGDDDEERIAYFEGRCRLARKEAERVWEIHMGWRDAN